ncbi:endonuclease MutS2 [Sporosalibacterium faouarense]|uniref:endonuclease MutS2 n=1 Tax=Sporosalibacterium faouarense TaxID=516123 RepID=UPI00192C957B|nr:endonuclease MutS2 [Sporosalibacterium faouarense]
MNKKTFGTLEFKKIKDKIKEYTASDLGKKLVDDLSPITDLNGIKNLLNLTTEARSILGKSPHIPLLGLHDIEDQIRKIEKGGILYPDDLAKVSSFLRGCSKMKKFMINQDYTGPTLSSYRYSITEFQDIEAEIESSIEGSRVSSKASSQLSRIRKKIDLTEVKIEQKLQAILNSSNYKKYIQDFFVSKRNGRYVIPVKVSYKNQIDGSVIDSSATGSTVFIEPSSITKMTNELSLLKAQEESEEYQILATISGYIGLHLKEIKLNLEVMAEYDFIFAKGKYSNSINGVEAVVNNKDFIKIIKGRHPLLEEDATPLDFKIGKDYRTLVITGPNTGGKTVALKTIGLLTLMTQSGLHIPAKKGTEISIFEKILVDIGDQQSIEQSLSTFSGHIKNIIEIINKTKYSTLILLDEVGTGTDPSEGAGLAASILEELYRRGGITVATTHYGEIKDFAEQHNGFENGCMEFDATTLKPLYRLLMGRAGKSNALWIAERLGMSNRVLDKARDYINTRNSIGQDKIKYKIDKVDIKLPQKKENDKRESLKNSQTIEFVQGDSVYIGNSDNKGIVYKTEDDNGYYIVFRKEQFEKIHKKRLRLHLSKDDLYPSGYDLDIIFFPYEKRKLKHDLDRGAIRDVREYRERVKEAKNE